MRRTRNLLLSLTVLLLGVTIAACDETTSSQRTQVVNLVNKERTSRKLSKLRQMPDLNTKAGNWAAKMRDNCKLSHSNFREGVTHKYRVVGENVGYAATIAKTHTALMNSPKHKGNILKPNYNRIGVGVASGKCGGYNVVFVSQVFTQAI